MNEATEIVNKDKKLAAETYLRMAKDKTPIEDILALLNDPEHIFTTKVTPIDGMTPVRWCALGNFRTECRRVAKEPLDKTPRRGSR